MKKASLLEIMMIIGAIFLLSAIGLTGGQDKYGLKAPNGISFSEVRGYENWQVVAPSYRTDKKEVRYILGNETIVKAYKDGVPENGKPFPDGSILVKIAYSEKKNPDFPAALEPEDLQRVELVMKDSKRFKNTAGWGFARFVYDTKTDSFTVYGKDPSFDQECYQCHTIVKNRDFIFTKYFKR